MRSHNVRIEYDPEFHNEAVSHPSFQASPHLTNLMYPHSITWQHGLGTLKAGQRRLDPSLKAPPDCFKL